MQNSPSSETSKVTLTGLQQLLQASLKRKMKTVQSLYQDQEIILSWFGNFSNKSKMDLLELPTEPSLATITSLLISLFLKIIAFASLQVGINLWDFGICVLEKLQEDLLDIARKSSLLPSLLITDKSYLPEQIEKLSCGTLLLTVSLHLINITTLIGSLAFATLQSWNNQQKQHSLLRTLLQLDGMVVSKFGTPISKSAQHSKLMKVTLIALAFLLMVNILPPEERIRNSKFGI